MNITFKISNIFQEKIDTMVVFYQFSNGVEFNNRFNTNSSISEIMTWGQIEAEKMELSIKDMENKLIDLQNQLLDN